MDPLGRQHRPAGHVALVTVEVRDPFRHLPQVLQGYLLTDIGFRNSLNLFLRQNLRGVPDHLLQGKTDFRSFFCCRRRIPLFHLVLFCGLIFRNLFHDTFALYSHAIPFHLGAGIYAIQLPRKSGIHISRRRGGKRRMAFRKQAQKQGQTYKIGLVHCDSPIHSDLFLISDSFNRNAD